MLVGNKIPGLLAEGKFHVNDFRETIRMNEKVGRLARCKSSGSCWYICVDYNFMMGQR
jgi:hypothetical protein